MSSVTLSGAKSKVLTNADMIRYVSTFLSLKNVMSVRMTSRLLDASVGTMMHYETRLRIDNTMHRLPIPTCLQTILHTQLSLQIRGVVTPTHIPLFANMCGLIFQGVHINKLTDLVALGSIHTLQLKQCVGVRDASALLGRVSVHTLDLSGCKEITHVSALGGVHTLYLSKCVGITDVSALGGVHTLFLSYCVGITDVSALGTVHTLKY
jgi:hypothetical protein